MHFDDIDQTVMGTISFKSRVNEWKRLNLRTFFRAKAERKWNHVEMSTAEKVG